MAGHHHRSGSGLKQKNKSHKTAKTTKSGQKRSAGAGRVERAGPGKKAGAAAGAKDQRRRRAQQLKDQRKGQTQAKRQTSDTDAPLSVAVVPLAQNAETDVLSALRADGVHVLAVPHGDVRGSIAAAAKCDVVVVVLAPTQKSDDSMEEDAPETYSPEADDVLTALKAQGLPCVVGICTGRAPDAYRLDIARRFFGREFGDAVPWADGSQNTTQAVRGATSKLPHWRSSRSRLHVLKAASQGTLLDVEGWVRDAALNVNRLVHVRGLGAARITACEVYATSTSPTPIVVLQGSNDEPLNKAATPDEMMGEQNLENLETIEEQPRKLKSDYQAAWDPDDDVDDDEAGIDVAALNAQPRYEDTEAKALLTLQEKYDEDGEFPDEVEVPNGAAARTRFARYRALRDVQASPFDAHGALPRQYGYVNTLRRFDAERKSALAEQGDVAVGSFVKLRLETSQACDASTLVGDAAGVSSLLKHENRLTVLHFLVKRVSLGTEEGGPLPAKELVEVMCGHRRWRARPVYSSHSPKHARGIMNRFLRPGDHVVCSVLGPLTFAPAPVVLFRQSGEACAVGAALTCDPDRIILKRSILSGVPLRSHKRKATIYKMFENPEDCTYFKPAQLVTKGGLTCHMTQALGSHGYFKVALSRPMSQADTVLLKLYKRVYPKFEGVDDTDVAVA